MVGRTAGPPSASLPAALRFEANLGQFDSNVRYVARVHGGALVLADEGATLALAARRATVTFSVAGGRAVEPRASNLVATHTNYFVGDRARWRTNVPNYGQVTYASVRDGIDVVYRGEGGVLEYDVIVAPQADPAAAVIDVGGSEGLAITPGGDLEIRTPGGRVVQAAPHVYQTLHGRREEVRGAYRIAGKSSVGFAVAQYDRSQPLVIDPVLGYATYLDADYGLAVAVDGAGHAYVAGMTLSLGLGTEGAVQPSYDDGDDAYVAKLDPSGTSLVYATYLGGAQYDTANGIAVDATGHAYVTGTTDSPDFPTTAGALNATGSGRDAFVTELAPDGASLAYSTYLGGASDDEGLAIAIDPMGRAYVSGTTYSPDFPHTSGLYPFSGQSTTVTVSNAFVASIAAGGKALVYSTCLGGEGNADYSSAIGSAVAVDAAGNAYVTGYANPNGFPLKNPFNPLPFLSTAFVTEVPAGGGSLAFSTFLEPTLGTAGIAVDSGGNVYLTGGAGNKFVTTAGAVQTTCPSPYGGGCSYVKKLAPGGASVVYSTYLGGSDTTSTSGIAVDAAGTAYVTGTTTSSDLPLVDAISGPAGASPNSSVGIVMAIDKTGGSFDYSTYFDHAGNVIAVDGAGNVTTAGTGVASASAFATCGALQTSVRGNQDAFVVRLAREGQPDAGPALCGAADAGGVEAGASHAGGGSTDGAAPLDAAASNDAGTADNDAGSEADDASAPPADEGGDANVAADANPPAEDAVGAGSPGSGPPAASGCQTSGARHAGGGSSLVLGMGLVVALLRRGRRRSRGR